MLYGMGRDRDVLGVKRFGQIDARYGARIGGAPIERSMTNGVIGEKTSSLMGC